MHASDHPTGAARGLGARAAAAARAAVSELRAAGVAPEALAEFVPAGRRWGVLPRPASMRPKAEVWRLGALLLDTDAGVYAAGSATRAAERGRPGYQSLSREDRREIAATALRAGYPAGTSVNFDATPLPLDDSSLRTLGDQSPLGVHGGELRVRWRAGASLDGAPTFQHYLAERLALLVDPPLGAD